MHGLLVGIHVGLLFISQYGLERRVQVPVGGPTTVLSLAISISQTFAINPPQLYLTTLVYLTQRLALRRILRSGTRTLTSIHDKQVAWSGLGSAVNAWRNQLSITASTWGVGIITVYLTLTAGLKVTTPALFRLVPANQSTSFAATSTLSSPFLLSSLWKGNIATEEYVYDPQLIAYATFMASMLMEKGSRTNDGFSLGLQNNMLYDLVAPNTRPGTTTVNTHTMDVTCGTSSPGFVTQFKSSVDGRLYWDLTRPWLMPGDYISEMALNVLYISPPGVSLQYFDGHLFRPLSKIELHTSFNVFDTSGKVAAQNFLAPPMNPVVSAGAQLQNLSAGGNFNLDIEAISKFNVSSLSYIVLASGYKQPKTQAQLQPWRSPPTSICGRQGSLWKHLHVTGVGMNRGLRELLPQTSLNSYM
ncbi:hypothetical protein C8J57DRAFT_1581699 [Mycena rebaudengoi]|nr:hypothetical protein C8J57DRAFT_1581699 [Mycena rebaudengoi]